MANHELAINDYLEGMKYKDIASKYGVSINTVKSWKKRYNWSREIISNDEKVASTLQNKAPQKIDAKTKKLRLLIENDLKSQLNEMGAIHNHYMDLVSDYLSLWDVKNKLIRDIEERGVVVEWSNGRQVGKKKNDSVNELNKTNAQMLRLLSELGLKATEIIKDDGGEGDDV